MYTVHCTGYTAALTTGGSEGEAAGAYNKCELLAEWPGPGSAVILRLEQSLGFVQLRYSLRLARVEEDDVDVLTEESSRVVILRDGIYHLHGVVGQKGTSNMACLWVNGNLKQQNRCIKPYVHCI